MLLLKKFLCFKNFIIKSNQSLIFPNEPSLILELAKSKDEILIICRNLNAFLTCIDLLLQFRRSLTLKFDLFFISLHQKSPYALTFFLLYGPNAQHEDRKVNVGTRGAIWSEPRETKFQCARVGPAVKTLLQEASNLPQNFFEKNREITVAGPYCSIRSCLLNKQFSQEMFMGNYGFISLLIKLVVSYNNDSYQLKQHFTLEKMSC